MYEKQRLFYITPFNNNNFKMIYWYNGLFGLLINKTTITGAFVY